MAALRQAISDGWADVAGGTYTEAEDPLLPLESVLWQFRRGIEVYPPTSTTAVSRRTRAGGSAFTPSCRRSPSGLDFGSRSTWALTPAGFRSERRRSGSGRAPTAATSRACCGRRWRPTGRRRGGSCPGGWRPR